MARSRNIKPAFFTNELLGVADPIVCLTFAGLWCLADKIGILEDRPLRIKAELFPYRESLDVNGYITELARLGFVVRYENEGRRFIHIKNFRKHQSPHNTEKAKGFPLPSDPKSLILADNRYDSVTQPLQDCEITEAKRPDSLIPDTGFTDSLIQKPTSDFSEPKTKKLVFTDDHMEFAKLMFQMILEAAPATKRPNMGKWANDIRMINEIDKRDMEEIHFVFRFANLDSFWRLNILSPAKLREKYSALHAKCMQTKNQFSAFNLAGQNYTSGDL